jgi:hypothetical protein
MIDEGPRYAIYFAPAVLHIEKLRRINADLATAFGKSSAAGHGKIATRVGFANVQTVTHPSSETTILDQVHNWMQFLPASSP